jgi:CheY-like chemotaxis protein
MGSWRRSDMVNGPHSKVRVLVVDDHRNLRESLALGLMSLGFSASTAASGREALSQLTTAPWDWLVCDLRMPEMDGIELAGRARALTPELKLILMTAYDASSDERRRISELEAVLLIKPVTADRLAESHFRGRFVSPEPVADVTVRAKEEQ